MNVKISSAHPHIHCKQDTDKSRIQTGKRKTVDTFFTANKLKAMCIAPLIIQGITSPVSAAKQPDNNSLKELPNIKETAGKVWEVGKNIMSSGAYDEIRYSGDTFHCSRSWDYNDYVRAYVAQSCMSSAEAQGIKFHGFMISRETCVPAQGPFMSLTTYWRCYGQKM
jgi:hypothetical protein